MSLEKPEAAPLAALGTVWLVGCGNLGRALAAGWLAAGLPAARLILVEPCPRDLPPGPRHAPAPSDALPRPDIVVLAVKPQTLAEAASGLAPHSAGALLLSVLAGVPLASLKRHFPHSRAIRALPSTPARIRRAVTLLVADAGAGEGDRAAAAALMGAVGTTHWIAEAQMDAASALAASGPAFLFAYIEASAAAGAANGLAPELAAALALETVAGSAALAEADPRPPAVLRAEVTSPGGMTRAGLDVLDGTGALTHLLTDTIGAAARRSAELGNP